MKAALIWTATLLVAGSFLVLDPAQTMMPTMLSFLRPLLVAGLAYAAMLGAGGALLQRWAPDVLSRRSAFLGALGLGMGLAWVLLGALATLGLARGPGCSLVLGLLAAAWALRPSLPIPRLPSTHLLMGLLLLAPGLVEALAPRTDTDELYYHLAIPRLIAESGHFVGGFEHPDGSRPLPIHLLYAAIYALGGEHAAPLWHLLLAASLALGVYQLAEERFSQGHGLFGALALLGSWTFAREEGLAYNNLPVTLWILLAADALLDRAFLRMALAAGLALSAKYTAAAPVLALLGVGALLSLRQDGAAATLRRTPKVLLAILLPILPWALRNWAEGLHPFFPYVGWPEGSGLVFMYNQKYGMGRDLGAMLQLPWNLLMSAEIDSFAFLGRISLLWGGLAIGALWAAWKGDARARLLVPLVFLGFVGWALGPHWLRYLLPLAGLAALAGAATRPHPALMVLFLASLPANFGPVLASASERISVVTGHERPDAFLERDLPAWPALRYLREQVPVDAPVALLFSWHGYYVRQPFVLGSVEDHVPTRFLLWRDGEHTLADLAGQGILYVLVGENVFSRKEFSFLSEGEWHRQFAGPESALDQQLLRVGVRLFRQNGFAVWRLQPKNETGSLDAQGQIP